MDARKRTGVAVAAVVSMSVLFGAGSWLLTQNSVTTVRTTASPLPESPAGDNLEFTAGGTATGATAGTDGNGVEMGPKEEVGLPEASPEIAATPPIEITVHVAGAVKKPGVYQFKPGDRVHQAIAAAGGFRDDAQQDALNLADTLRDADQLNIPVKATPAPKTAPLARPTPPKPVIIAGTPPRPAGVRATPEPPRGRVLGKEPPVITNSGMAGDSSQFGSSGSGSEGGSKSSNKLRVPGEGYVNINTADAIELQRLPGVGPAMSQRILDYRQSIGRFADPSQLQDVKGIGEKTYAKMQPFVRVD